MKGQPFSAPAGSVRSICAISVALLALGLAGCSASPKAATPTHSSVITKQGWTTVSSYVTKSGEVREVVRPAVRQVTAPAQTVTRPVARPVSRPTATRVVSRPEPRTITRTASRPAPRLTPRVIPQATTQPVVASIQPSAASVPQVTSVTIVEPIVAAPVEVPTIPSIVDPTPIPIPQAVVAVPAPASESAPAAAVVEMGSCDPGYRYDGISCVQAVCADANEVWMGDSCQPLSQLIGDTIDNQALACQPPATLIAGQCVGGRQQLPFGALPSPTVTFSIGGQ